MWASLSDLLVANRMWWKWWYMTSEVIEKIQLPPGTFLLLCHSRRGSHATLWGHSKTLVVKNWDLPQAASINLPAPGGRYLESGSSSPNQTFTWLQLGLTSDCNLMRRPEPLSLVALCDYCCFKPLSSGVICYAAIDN